MRVRVPASAVAILTCLAGCFAAEPEGRDPRYEAPDLEMIRDIDGVTPLLEESPEPGFEHLVYVNYPAVPGGHLPKESYRTRVALLEVLDGLSLVRTHTETRDTVVVRDEIGLAGLVELGVLDSKDFNSPFGKGDRFQFRIEAHHLALPAGPPLLRPSGETELRVVSSYAMWRNGHARDLGEIEQIYRFRRLGVVEDAAVLHGLGIPGPGHRIRLEVIDPDGTEVEEILWSPALGAVVQRRIGTPAHTHVELESWTPRRLGRGAIADGGVRARAPKPR